MVTKYHWFSPIYQFYYHIEPENPHADDHTHFESKEESEQKQPKMTYDMLRAQNRMKYPEMMRKPEEKEIISKASRPSSKSSNRYGDEIVEWQIIVLWILFYIALLDWVLTYIIKCYLVSTAIKQTLKWL